MDGYLEYVDPDGGVFAEFGRRNRVEVEPKVGLVHFAANDFVGELEVHRLHSFGGRRFCPLQGVANVRNCDISNSYITLLPLVWSFIDTLQLVLSE